MSKKTALFFILLLSLLIYSCGRKTGREIIFAAGGAPNELDFWETLLEEFKTETGLAIKLHRQPTDSDQRRQGLVIALKSRQKDPDIFLMDVAWISQLAASGWLEPLSVDSSRCFEKVVKLADTYQGKLVALPVYVDGGLLYYRKDLLKKYGFSKPPVNWEDLVTQAEKIQKGERSRVPDFYGYVWQGAQYEGLVCNFLEASASFGGGFYGKDNKISVNSPENLAALKLMRGFIRENKISPPSTYTEMKEEEVRTYFQQGKALFERNWPYAWALHQAADSVVAGKTGIAPLPALSGQKSAATLGGWHIGISKFSDAKSEAEKFLLFVTSVKIQKKLALTLGWNPGNKEVYSDPEVLEKLPHFAELAKVFENALPRPGVPYYTQVSEILQRSLNAALAGEKEPEAALAEADTEITKIVKRYGP